MKAFAPAFFLLLASVVVMIALQARVLPDDRQVAVMFPIGSDFTDNFVKVAGAGVFPVRSGGMENIIVVEISSSRDLENLYHAGAWMVFNPSVLGYCIII